MPTRTAYLSVPRTGTDKGFRSRLDPFYKAMVEVCAKAGVELVRSDELPSDRDCRTALHRSQFVIAMLERESLQVGMDFERAANGMVPVIAVYCEAMHRLSLVCEAATHHRAVAHTIVYSNRLPENPGTSVSAIEQLETVIRVHYTPSTCAA